MRSATLEGWLEESFIERLELFAKSLANCISAAVSPAFLILLFKIVVALAKSAEDSDLESGTSFLISS